MARNRVQHWKHGWIPVSPEAKAYMAGRGPKPIGRNWSPNNASGLPTKRTPDDLDGAQRRVADIKEFFPETNPSPHHQFASQSMAAHYTGGVVFSAEDTDKILDRLESNHEGTASRLDVAEASGEIGLAKARLVTNTAKGNREEQARRRARRLKNYLGLEFGPRPYYQKVEGELTGRTASGYTGGIVMDRPTTEEFIKRLNERFVSGKTTQYAVRRAGGV
jgi:hypothetical protein